MNQLPEQIFIDILKTQMNLANNQIWIRNQNYDIPDTDGLFIVVGMADSQVFSNVNTPISTESGMSQEIQIISRDNIQIDIFSRNTDAIFRRSEVLAALNSVYSQQKQEDNSFVIFRLPTSFTNTSSAEGGSNLNRFSIIISCHSWYTQITTLAAPNDYYNEFSTEVVDEKNFIPPLIEFDIST